MTPSSSSLNLCLTAIALICLITLTISVEVEITPSPQCGQLPPDSFQDFPYQKLYPPWSVTVKKNFDGIREEIYFAGVLITPKIIMSTVSYFINDTVLIIPPFKYFGATLGQHRWRMVGNHSINMGISHLTMHPRYSQGNYWSNTKNDQVLFHLNEAVNITDEIQPICLPKGDMIDKIVLPQPNPLILTGWNRNTISDEFFLNLVIDTPDECLKKWKSVFITDVYEHRFCANVSGENNHTNCIHQDVAGVKKIGDSFYLAGQVNNLFSKYGVFTCPDEAVYFFNILDKYTYSWIRNTVKCGSENFTCGSGKCIPRFRMCNRYKDCEDGEDEFEYFCKYLYKCSEGEFYCGQGDDHNCIPDSKVNDGVKDCTNGEDEFDYHPPISKAQIAVAVILVVATLVVVGLILNIEYRKYQRHLSSISENDREPLLVAGFDQIGSITHNYDTIPAPWKSNPNLDCIELLGKGGFCIGVYKAFDRTDVCNPLRAIKCVNIRQTLFHNNAHHHHLPSCSSSRSPISDEEVIRNALRKILNEMRVQDDLQFDNVVKYSGCWAEAEDASTIILSHRRLQEHIEKLLRDTSNSKSADQLPMSQIFIKTEYCDFTLKQRLEKQKENQNPPQTIIEDYEIAKGIASGLKYIHSKGYIHRDLKPGNLFCKLGQEDQLQEMWKIGDFGLAIKNSPGIQEVVGTPSYRCPEMMNGLPYGEKADLFSLGLVFVELIQQQGRLFNRITTFDRIRELLRDDEARFQYLFHQVANGRCENFVRLITQLLSFDPDLRPSAQVLLIALNDC